MTTPNTPNTPENKAAFMAMYYGQNIVKPTDSDVLFNVSQLTFQYIDNVAFIQLRSIESLTDEEAITVAKNEFSFFNECAGGKDFNLKVVRALDKISVAAITDDAKTCLAKIEVNNPWKLNFKGIDYLRSISIALPWRDLSIDQLIEYGWIKII